MRSNNSVRYSSIGLRKEDEKLIVSGIWENSSDAKSGTKIEDRITRINSFEVCYFSIVELMGKISLKKQKNTIDVEYENETGKHNICLKKEYLLPVIDK